jgi:hypothetical protein
VVHRTEISVGKDQHVKGSWPDFQSGLKGLLYAIERVRYLLLIFFVKSPCGGFRRCSELVESGASSP